jgi:anti-sigma-K factor RskA
MGVSAHRDEHLDLCAGWALGCLDEDDRLRLEEHLEGGCGACETALAEFSANTVLLARSAPARPPSRSLRDRVLIAAGSSRPGTAGSQPERVAPIPMAVPRGQLWFATAAAAALLVFAGLQFDRADRLGQQLAEQRQWSALALAPGVRVAEFTLTPAGAALEGRALYDPRTHSAMLMFEHAGAPAGHDYEVWAIRGGTPAALGVLHADPAGHALLKVADAGEPASLAAFAVSLEPPGGSPHHDRPTGPVVLLGKLGG